MPKQPRVRPIPDILAGLDRNRLADILDQLGHRHAEVFDYLQLLGADPDDRLRAVRNEINGLGRRRAFVPYSESAELADDLDAALTSLVDASLPPDQTLDLAARFLCLATPTLERCDDSSGVVGDVFRGQAVDVFVDAAKTLGDDRRACDLVVQVLEADEFTVCWGVLERAGEYLDTASLRGLVDHYLERTRKIVDIRGSFSPDRHAVQVLAKVLVDPDLFAGVLREHDGRAVWVDVLELARVQLAAGRAEEALASFQGVQLPDFAARDRDELLLAIHTARGDMAAAAEVVWRLFRGERSVRTLEQLLAVVGAERRDAIVAAEVAAIEASPALAATDVRFLFEMAGPQGVAGFVEARHEQLDGGQYDWVSELAQRLDRAGEARAASLAYRALLESILAGARSKAYGHGARYLHRLDELAPAVTDWGRFADHAAFRTRIEAEHRRKRSFWERCGDGGDSG